MFGTSLSAFMSSDTNAHHFLVHISQLHPSHVCFCSHDGTTKYYVLVKSGIFSFLPVHRAPMLDKSKYGVKELPNLCFCQQGLIKVFESCKYIKKNYINLDTSVYMQIFLILSSICYFDTNKKYANINIP